MFICKECKNAYEKGALRMNRKSCPRPECHGELVEIDDVLAPIIRKMWDYDIVTKYCCSGHPASMNDVGSAYIIFNLNESGIIMHECAKYVINTCYTSDDCPEVIIEYTPALNKYMIELPFGGFESWLAALKFLNALTYEIEHVSEIIKNDHQSCDTSSPEDYFYAEFLDIDVDDKPVTFRIGAFVNTGIRENPWEDETQEFWGITHFGAYTMYGEISEHGEHIPHEFVSVKNEIDFETFKKFNDVIGSKEELMNIINGEEKREENDTVARE